MSIQITKHFALHEFASRGEPVPEQCHDNLRRLCEQLEVLRAHVGGRAITIVCGWRSAAHNKGKASKSQHLTASAADIRVAGMHPELVASTIEGLITRGEMTQGGLHAYPEQRNMFTHVDIRGTRARW